MHIWQYMAMILFCCLLISCTNQQTTENSLLDVQKKTLIVNLFYTGELLGELEPCGCSGGKLGGMLLRSGWIDHLRKEYPDLFLLDGGFAAKNWDRQDHLKFSVHRNTLHVLKYNLQFLHEKESLPPNLECPDTPKLLSINDELGSLYHYEKWTQNELSLGILFLAMEKNMPLNKEKFQRAVQEYNPEIVFIVTKGIYTGYDSLVPEGKFLRIFFPVDSPAPYSPLEPSPGILVISAGNKGRYAGIFSIELTNQQTISWKNSIISLEKQYDANPQIETLLDQYTDTLEQERLLDFVIKRSSPIGFIGTENCIECHQNEYKIWQMTKHAHAFQTLVDVKHHYDPECVGCHVIGFEYEEGFRSIDDTDYLINVGCEACHGPGAEQAMNPVAGFGKHDKKPVCLTCHEKDRSPNFNYEEFREKIRHWQD
ncbi:MAG: hypothetical protein KBC30_05505 [Planctomycetes bacterium]|nr:hypothetical protein [Planctomycetota bacterium]HPY74885.1 cytochrome c family protein [Planctomycetota bacterium]HQB00518.1 cytochrome c family protein [Planctomycetota bacterium]HRU51478.1 cytochrome c family protein [Planctomycetota bacterium]